MPDNDKKHERDEEATNSQTLSEIEEDANVSEKNSDAAPPSPDEGAGRSEEDDAGDPI